MPEKPIIRAAQPDDLQAWRALWDAYCAALGATIPAAVTAGLWQRILDADHPVGCLVACGSWNEPVGFAHSSSIPTPGAYSRSVTWKTFSWRLRRAGWARGNT